MAFAAQAADSKEEVIAAAKKLGEAANYSWKSTVVVPEGSPFRPGPTNGKADKDGTIYITTEFGDNLSETVIKGERAAMTNQDGDWQSIAEVEGSEGFGRFRAAMARNFRAPAAQAVDLVNAAKELKKDGDAIVGDLTEEGAKQFVAFRRGGGASAKNASGSVKFWVKDGALVKYEFKVKGTVTFNDQDRDVDRTTTTEINKVGETKLVVPEGAKKKLT